MPNYDYYCDECGETFEVFLEIDQSDKDLVCPACGGVEVFRDYSSISMGNPKSGCSSDSDDDSSKNRSCG